MDNKTDIFRLLDKLKTINSADKERGNQAISPKEDLHPWIQMLDEKTRRPLSPMLSARFEYCGEWENAHLSQNWLSLSQIDKWKSNSILNRWVELSIENTYNEEPPGGVPHENCTVFGYNPYEPEETYLVWRQDQTEPAVWQYFGGDFFFFDNLQSYLEYITGEKSHNDSGRF